MIKKIFSLVGLFLLVLSVTKASCSLGATPLSASAQAMPGQTVEVTWNLYNLYGDRPTHVVLSVTSDVDWNYWIEPELHEVTYNVSGVLITTSENLAIPPRPVVTYKPSTIAAGEDYIKHPSKDGYIPVSTVKIYIEVPENATLWETHKFTITAQGNCFTIPPGTVIPAVSTSLDVNLQVVSQEYYEELVISTAPWYVVYLPWIVLVAVLAALAILIYVKGLLKSKPKRRRKR